MVTVEESDQSSRRALAWRDAVLRPDATLQQAIENLDQTGMRIVLVAGDGGQLVGTVSDGDIRRALLKGMGMNGSLSTVLHTSPFVVPLNIDSKSVLHLMVANKIQQVPVVDENHRLVGLHLWDEIAESPGRENVIVIMAGGQGKRLRPFTKNCPKPLLPVAGKPMLEHIIERAKLEGFRRFVIAIHYLGHMIEEHFGNGEHLSVEIEYLREEEALGTAGALELLRPRPELPVVVTNGDVLTDIRYGELLDFHNRYGASATMAVRMHEWQHPFGVVRINGVDIVNFEEKPVARTHINAGVYALDPAALDQLQPGTLCDMPMLFEKLRDKGGRTVAYPMHEPWLDVGRPEDLQSLNGDDPEIGKDHPA